MNKTEPQPNSITWCGRCGTRHLVSAICPRVIDATAPEVVAWRVGAHTSEGVQGIGVMLAPCGRRWRARVVSFPNVLWTAPGSHESMKFLGATREDALRRAQDFVRRHCVTRGYLMRDELECVPAGGAETETLVGSDAARRIEKRLPVLFGVKRPTERGATYNLSLTGMFISTDAPRVEGSRLGLSLELEYSRVPMRGEVTWTRSKCSPGTIAGMGVQLIKPPGVYTHYVERLTRTSDDD